MLFRSSERNNAGLWLDKFTVLTADFTDVIKPLVWSPKNFPVFCSFTYFRYISVSDWQRVMTLNAEGYVLQSKVVWEKKIPKMRFCHYQIIP